MLRFCCDCPEIGVQMISFWSENDELWVCVGSLNFVQGV